MRKATLLLATAMLLLGLAAQAASDQQIADINLGVNQLSIEPMVAASGMVITIAGPNGYYLQKSLAAETQALSLDGLANGSYHYELRLLPVIEPEILKTMAAARQSGDTATISMLQEEGKVPTRALVQSGTFTMAKGGLVDMDVIEGVTTKDVLHYDDVIITGSLCVGFDCVDGESFGYSTIKLKENNLQLAFEDTSIGTFPTNDWRIWINDTTSGGASYFAVRDDTTGRNVFRIEAGAPASSLYVEDYGRVGLGTSIPYVELHIVNGDSPTVRLDQDGSSGWTPQVWDLCGNESNFFIRDVTNGSKLCFRIQPNTPSNTLCMRSDGKVGIGTWSPANKLDISNSVDDNFGFQLSGLSHQWVVQLNKTTDATAPNGLAFTKVGTGVREMQLQTDGDLYITGRYYSNGTMLNVPDFVFEEGYSLLPLNELERFITSERHLPNVPSSAEIKAEGLNLSDMQMRLLEKVEELTLYTLRQEKTITNQQAMIEELQARLTALER